MKILMMQREISIQSKKFIVFMLIHSQMTNLMKAYKLVEEVVSIINKIKVFKECKIGQEILLIKEQWISLLTVRDREHPNSKLQYQVVEEVEVQSNKVSGKHNKLDNQEAQIHIFLEVVVIQQIILVGKVVVQLPSTEIMAAD